MIRHYQSKYFPSKLIPTSITPDLKYSLGVEFAKYNSEDSNNTAFQLFKQAADCGHVEAWYKLGGCYYRGRGCSQDFAKAVQCYHEAARLGSHDAHRNLFAIYIVLEWQDVKSTPTKHYITAKCLLC